jgi:hypothetical protein
MTPGQLSAVACRLVADPDRKLGASRLLAAALLLRQALEDAIDAYWDQTVPALQDVSARAQLISLPFYLGPRLAGDVTYAWNRLSVAGHHGTYQLPPAPGDLRNIARTIDHLIAATAD